MQRVQLVHEGCRYRVTPNGKDVKAWQMSRGPDLRANLEVEGVNISSEKSCFSLQETQVDLSDTLSRTDLWLQILNIFNQKTCSLIFN